MSQLGTVYATKRRRRNGKSLKPPPKDGVTKSNPSKRHRERLNAELDLLASLLPFEQNILSKLDRLSILRLSVSYLRTKSYFQAVMHKDKDENGVHQQHHHLDGYASSRHRELDAFEHGMLEGDMFLQALNGFLMILTCEGEVFFATHSIESYLGFHQSDIVHQSVYELVHSEDREELQRQLLWNSFLPADSSAMSLTEAMSPDRTHLLERSFTVRFRCLLDNTSGFLRLDIRGRVKILHGQNRKTEDPPLGLFAYCTPFGPPSLLEIPQKENMFKSKHKLDFSLVSMDQRGKSILGFSDAELANMGGYDLVHFDDLAYVASAHQELLKTGASGMIAYRYQKKDNDWQWLQTSSRLVYKNSKPDFVICTHRQLMDEEGRDLLGKRTMDFKVSYLDTGLASTYFSESDQLVIPPSGSPNSLPPPVTPQRTTRRYKTQLRDFLSTCRSKRKLQQQSGSTGTVTPPAPVVDYIPDTAAAVAAAYSNLNPMYSTSPYAPSAENLYMTPSVHSSNFYPVTDNLFHQYRLQGVGGYYPEYHHSAASATYVTNGFLPYDSYGIPAGTKDEKWQDSGKYYMGHDVAGRSVYPSYGSPTPTGPTQIIQSTMKTPKPSPTVADVVSCSSEDPSPSGHPPATPINQSLVQATQPNRSGGHHGRQRNGTSTAPLKTEHSPSEPFAERQTVLMWGSTSNSNASSNRSPNNTPTSNGVYADPIHSSNKAASMHMTMSASAVDDHNGTHHKWNGHPHKETSATASTGIVYQITHLPDAHTDSAYSTSGGHLAHSPHHGQHEAAAAIHHSPQNHHHHQHGVPASNSIASAHHPIGSGCEVLIGRYQLLQYDVSHQQQQRPSITHFLPVQQHQLQHSGQSIDNDGTLPSGLSRAHVLGPHEAVTTASAQPHPATSAAAYTDHPDGSPLLSFSEVTNTLLNQ